MSSTTDWIAANIERIEGGHMTLHDLETARFTLRNAAKELRTADERIAAAQESLRDRFAMAALTGIIAESPGRNSEGAAVRAYAIADGMLSARKVAT